MEIKLRISIFTDENLQTPSPLYLCIVKMKISLGFNSIPKCKTTVSLTNVNNTTNLVISPSILPREICNGPSNSWDGMTYVVLAKLKILAMAKRMSETVSGSSCDHSNRPESEFKCDTQGVILYSMYLI